METTFRRISTTCLTCLAALGLSACGPSDSGGSDTGTTTDSTGTGSGTGDDGGSDDGGTGSDDGGSSDGGDDGTTGGDDGSTSDGTTAPPEPLPNGSPCTTNDDCESGFCYSTALGSVCSECLTDSDCWEDEEVGTCAIDASAGYAVCTDGSQGMMCDSDEGCQGDLVCAELIDTQGYFPANFCSECKTTADCDGNTICSPYFDAGAFSGYMECVEPGTVPNDQGCPVDDVGVGDDAVCESGFCGVAAIQGVVYIGVCGECDPDTDEGCDGSETCNPPTADMSGISGAYCGGGGGTGTGTGTGSFW